MTETTIQQPGLPCIEQHRHRVSLREIRETAWRALFSAGLSTGEAGAAADVIASMQLHEGTGLAALADQLRRPLPGRRPAHLHRDAVTWIEDPADRGPLLLAPMVIDLALAERLPVLIPSASGDAAYEWYAIQACGPNHPDLWLIEITPEGRILLVTNVSDGILRRDVPSTALTSELRALAQECAASGGGVLIYPCESVHVDPGTVVSTAPERARRRDDALARGVTLDADEWAAAIRASRRFLVGDVHA
ncbi:hypothetical protein BH09ACT8_BH09ACT8_04350 [soil metagenome]